MEEGGVVRAPHNYSRKQKSLGLLCSNFISLYNREGIESVGLDDAAARLGVERRRIYDIVNVLESVGVLARKAKNRYSWIGFSGIPQALKDLKEEALREIAGNPLPRKPPCGGVSDDDEEDDKSSQQTAESGGDQAGSASKAALDAAPLKARSGGVTESRKEKSLGLLTQNFVKLFLTTNMVTISLDEAARLLLGDGDSSQMRNNAAKVRRLYDIANVLSSMNLIEKTQHADSRKPAFRWLGVNGKPDNVVTVAVAPFMKQTKRAFGMDITNTDFKRSKVIFSAADGKQRKVRSRSEDIKECNLAAQRQLEGSKGCVFGPFCPPVVAGGEEEGEVMGEKGALDWEAVANSFRPQYHNQALNELFAHYVEAWKSWYVELAQGGNTFQSLTQIVNQQSFRATSSHPL